MSTRTKTKYEISCPICSTSNQLKKFRWNRYDVIHCKNCDLDYCSDMIEKEIGGDSSPVHMEGISMMADVFFKTGDLANSYANLYIKKPSSTLMGVFFARSRTTFAH